MLHTDERPYRCDFPGCDAAFTQGVQLKNHKSSHLRKQGLVAPDDHQCERCGKYLATRSALNSHIMTVHDKVVGTELQPERMSHVSLPNNMITTSFQLPFLIDLHKSTF